MAEIGNWNGIKFIVSPTLIRGFNGLSVTGESNTENKTSGSQEYVSRKSGKPVEIGLTVELNRSTGCDVRSEALSFVAQARDGAKSYFYIGGSKLMACQLMLIKASVTETAFAPNGTMISAKVALTMRQCGKNDGTSANASSGGSSSGSSSSKSSVKKKTTTTTTKKTVSEIITATQKKIGSVISSIKNSSIFKTAQSVVNKVVSNAKKVSTTVKKNPVTVKKAVVKKVTVKKK